MLTFRHFLALGALFSSLACVQANPALPGDEQLVGGDVPSTGGPSNGGPSNGGDTGPDALGCPDDAAFFRARLWEPVMSVQCITCHNASGMAAGTRLVLTPPEQPGADEKNFRTVRDVARLQFDGTSVLLLKPTGKHPQGHGGGALLGLESTRYTDFRRFTERVRGVPGACDSGEPPKETCTPDELDPSATRQLRMLTRFEYDNTLRDLLYLDTPSTWGQALPAEEVTNGFDNAAASRTVGVLLTDKLLAASEQAATAAVAKLSRHVSCSQGEACAFRYIQDFGARAFREPLTTEERTRYQTLYKGVAADEGYLEGLKAVTSAMLLSPHFLYRSELGTHQGGGRYVLTDYEVASELSYLLWGSMPDETLFAQARKGELHTPEQITAEARRMLTSPRSRPVLDHFMSLWLELEKVEQVQKDAAVLADFNPALRSAMKAETLELFDHVVRGGSGQLSELFSADYTFATDALATFYGLNTPLGGTPTASGARKWALEGTGRGGLLTHAAILASQATPQAPSPVRRGKLVRERLLCQPLPAAPPGLDLELGETDPTHTNRQRFQKHSSNPACSSCHQLMDPIGFGFEQFDSVGRFAPRMANGTLVDASGEVVASAATQGPFTGVAELQAKLARSPDVEDCFSLQWLRFAYGVEGEEHSCVSSQLSRRFREGKLSIPELIVSLTRLPRFTQRWGVKEAPTEPDPFPGGGTDGGTGGGTDGGMGPGPGGGTDGGTGGDAGTPVPPGGLVVTQTVQSEWGAGYCRNVKVVNRGTARVTWRLSLKIEGTLTNFWSTLATFSGGVAEFVGEDWNAELGVNASTTFGYCANR